MQEEIIEMFERLTEANQDRIINLATALLASQKCYQSSDPDSQG